MRLCIGLCVLFICGLPAIAVHAGEVGDVAGEPASSGPVSTSDALSAQLESEVLRYYSGIGAEPTKEELNSALTAARDMLLAGVSIIHVSAAVKEAVERHEGAEVVQFSIAVPRLVRALAEQAHARQSEASELALQRARRAGANSQLKRRATEDVLRDRKKGTGLMTAAFVAQGISLGTTFAGLLVGDTVVQFNWPVQLGTIPFAPMGVGGFALRFGGSSESERLRWTGIGLLQAAAYSGVMGALSVGSVFTQDYFWVISLAGAISYFSASISFVIAGASCVGASRRAKHRQGLSQSRRSPPRSSRPALVLPTIAPRPGGLSLGLVAVF